MTAAGVHVAHGWTMADVHRAAAYAVASARGHHTDHADRYDAAWHAIAAHLCTAAEPPRFREMTLLGMDAVSRALADWRHHHGISARGGDAPKTLAYWLALAAPTPSPEDRVVDAVALAQIWPALREVDREAFAMLAAHGTYAAAAAALGLEYGTFARRIRVGRQRFLALWHEGETPSGMWRYDRRADRTAGSRRTPFTGRKRAARSAAA